MAWVFLIVAGLLEVVWAFSLKQSAGFTRLVPSVITIVAMVGSVWFLAIAMRVLPLGTSYTIWTGIGTLGAFIVGIAALGEDVTALRVFAVVLIVSGLVLMKAAPSSPSNVADLPQPPIPAAIAGDTKLKHYPSGKVPLWWVTLKVCRLSNL